MAPQIKFVFDLIIYSRENINMRNQKHSVSLLGKLSVYEK